MTVERFAMLLILTPALLFLCWLAIRLEGEIRKIRHLRHRYQNAVDPVAYLRHVLTHIADHFVSRIDELLAWNLVEKLT